MHAVTYIFPAAPSLPLTLFVRLILGLMALLFKYIDLVDLVSVGTLFVYSPGGIFCSCPQVRPHCTLARSLDISWEVTVFCLHAVF